MKKLLDLFCRAGGASMGYMRAGFEVVGVDINPQPNYPFEFLQADVLDFTPEFIRDICDVAVGSPPCQKYSTTASLHDNVYPDLVMPVRELLRSSGLPYVIENVPGAPLEDPLMLCGSSFALPIRRHRMFESNFPITGPTCDHWWQDRRKPYWTLHRGLPSLTGVVSVHGGNQHSPDGKTWGEAFNIQLASVALGIDWMKTKDELNQSIPPVYTHHIGKQLLKMLW